MPKPLPGKPFSLKVLEGRSYVREDHTAELYLCEHLSGLLTVHAEASPEDAFPGSRPYLEFLRKEHGAMRTPGDVWEEGQRAFEARKWVPLQCQNSVPAQLLDRIKRPELEADVAIDTFYSRLLRNLACNPFGLAVRPLQREYYEECQSALEDLSLEPDALQVFSTMLADLAIDHQEGVFEVLPSLPYCTPQAIVERLSASLTTYMEQTVKLTQSTTTRSPMAYDIAHLALMFRDTAESASLRALATP